MGRQTSERYRLSITDQGRGLKAEQMANLGPYTQFDRSVYAQQGAGLGLFIVNELTKLNHGHFSISSQIGGPTTVTIEVPLVTNLG